MPLIIVFLSSPIPVPVLHTYLGSLYRVDLDTILMDDGTREEALTIEHSPEIWCTYYARRGEFPLYLELGVAPLLMPGLDDTRSDYWFATRACTAFTCSALIPPLRHDDPYESSHLWIRPGHAPCLVSLDEDGASASDPVIDINREASIVPIDGAAYEQGPPIYGLSITITWWPEWHGVGIPVVQATFRDVHGHQWVFHEKASFMTTVELDAQSPYPQPGILQCHLLNRTEQDGRTIVTITTHDPWRLKATTGDDHFDVDAELVTLLSTSV